MTTEELQEVLVERLKPSQIDAVKSEQRKLLVVAGAGSGKTEVMARRIAWWVGIEKVPKESIIAFTFTEKAAKEIKYRVRRWIERISGEDENVNLSGMFIGTIHGFCLSKIREFWPNEYHNFDILDESARFSLISRGFHGVLGLSALKTHLGEKTSQGETIEQFISAYDQLHEHNRFEVRLPAEPLPVEVGRVETGWCSRAELLTNVGDDLKAEAFAVSAARYYAYLKCRRFLDFSTSQTEFINKLRTDPSIQDVLEQKHIHLVVDEMQDTNPVQMDLIRTLVGSEGRITAVGDHRQSIYGFRGAKVELVGELWEEFSTSTDAEIIDLQHNFRSTPRIINIANDWADTISELSGLHNVHMEHGKEDRLDLHNSHVAIIKFDERENEAAWIAEAIRAIVPNEQNGAAHDKRDGSIRGLALSDIAVLVRSTTDIQTYMRVLQAAGIESIVRSGPDLFSQPEVLLFLSTLAISAGIDEFYGSTFNPKSIVKRIENSLKTVPFPRQVLRKAGQKLRESGLIFPIEVENRLLSLCDCLRKRIFENVSCSKSEVAIFRDNQLKRFLTRSGAIRRVFPQTIYHWLLTEAEVENWDTVEGRGESALFHLGSLSNLITGIETPGWTDVGEYRFQIISLTQYGAKDGRDPEQPLLVQPDAVTISTIHGVKGLEFPAVFLADVCSRRFPSSYAKRRINVPISGNIVEEIDIAGLSDNANNDAERRLMYVALTRTERFLIVSGSGKSNSKFFKELQPIFRTNGGIVTEDPATLLDEIRHAPIQFEREIQLSTSFSELRYYLACPHDFYLRKVLGFSPTIDQAFGYGRGVHNLMREIHSNPEFWAEAAQDLRHLNVELERLIEQGLFYLRYTTGDPAVNMRNHGIEIVGNYIKRYMDELSSLNFEPEKEFETLIDYEGSSEGVMISGAIDIIRKDDPPQVTLIDFKSGHPESDNKQKLDEEEMKLQIGIYAIAAKNELEYEPEQGLVRYLDVLQDDSLKLGEMRIPLTEETITAAREQVVGTAKSIRDRQFDSNPLKSGTDGTIRCSSCDFLGICGMAAAKREKHT